MVGPIATKFGWRSLTVLTIPITATSMQPICAIMNFCLEVATPTPAPFQAAAAMLLPGEVTATA